MLELVDQERIEKELDREAFHAVAEVADEMEVQAYVIGGWVRDLLLGKECKDIDFVFVGSGVEAAERSAEKLGASDVHIFKRYGTAMIRYKDLELEFVGARKESYSSDSRKPAVEDGTLQDDLNRRDLTINALAICLNQEAYGEWIDPFGGIEDLRNGIIRTPLDTHRTFSDDPLRMMRAIRFATQFRFKIEEGTLQGIQDEQERIEIVSMERIIDELNKIVRSGKPSLGFKLLQRTGLLKRFFPEMTELKGVEERKGITHKDNFYHTLQVLDNLAQWTEDLWLRWAAILHDIGKPPTKRFDEKEGWTFHGHDHVGSKMVKKIFRRLKLPLDHRMKYVRKLVALHLRPIALATEEVTDSAVRRLIHEAGDDLEDLLLLCQADITSKNKKKVKQILKNYELVKKKVQEVEEKDRVRNFEPPVSGEDVMQAFDLPPSKMVGDIKQAVKDAVLEGTISNDRQEAWDYMLKKGKEQGLEPREDRVE